MTNNKKMWAIYIRKIALSFLIVY